MPRPKRAALKRRLTELSVRKLKPKSDDVPDLGHPAARARDPGAADRRSGLEVIYSRHGRPRWLHLGDAGAIGLADARTLAAEAMLEVARGKDPAAEKRAERGAGTFAELAAALCRDVRQEAQQELAAGRLPRAPLPAAALGQAAGGVDHPRRRAQP